MVVTPYLFFSTSEHDRYHEPTDDLDTVDGEVLRVVARAAYRTVLAIDALDGVQWVPGTGQPQGTHWADVYRRIGAAGKKMLLYDLETVDLMASEGFASQIAWRTAGEADAEAHAREVLAKHRVT